MNLSIGFLTTLRQRFQKQLAIGSTAIDQIALVSTTHHVVHRTWILKPNFMCYEESVSDLPSPVNSYIPGLINIKALSGMASPQ